MLFISQAVTDFGGKYFETLEHLYSSEGKDKNQIHEQKKKSNKKKKSKTTTSQGELKQVGIVTCHRFFVNILSCG